MENRVECNLQPPRFDGLGPKSKQSAEQCIGEISSPTLNSFEEIRRIQPFHLRIHQAPIFHAASTLLTDPEKCGLELDAFGLAFRPSEGLVHKVIDYAFMRLCTVLLLQVGIHLLSTTFKVLGREGNAMTQ